MKTPKWASEIVTDICKELGVPEPTMNWWTRREVEPLWISERYGGDYWAHVVWKELSEHMEYCSFGQCFLEGSEIDIFAGSDRKDQKIVLLHEMSHYVLNVFGYTKARHSPMFWDQCFKLFMHYGVPIMNGIDREKNGDYAPYVKAWAKRQGIPV